MPQKDHGIRHVPDVKRPVDRVPTIPCCDTTSSESTPLRLRKLDGSCTQAPALLEGQSGDVVLADKTYDSNALRATMVNIGAEAMIPSSRCPRIPIPHDASDYKLRNRIERCL